MKKLKCCGCKDRYPADTMVKLPAGNFHSFGCATYYAQAKSEKTRAKAKKLKVKQEKKSHSAAKRKLKNEDKSFQLKKTQRIFNSYIRCRDEHYPCISCSRFHSGQYHAGHYRSVGGNPELRFNTRNCHKQCAPCNNNLSGNICNYRLGLVDRYSSGYVDYLEGPHPAKRYTIDNLKTLQHWFNRKTKRLLKEIDA